MSAFRKRSNYCTSSGKVLKSELVVWGTQRVLNTSISKRHISGLNTYDSKVADMVKSVFLAGLIW